MVTTTKKTTTNGLKPNLNQGGVRLVYPQNSPKMTELEKLSLKVTRSIGTPQSIIIHSFFFAGIFLLNILGIALDTIMLILTTVVSLEAIYLSLLIQMTVNRNTMSLEEFGEDIEDIQEDVKELGEEVEEISEDLEDIQEEDEKDNKEDKQTKMTLVNIEEDIDKLLKDIDTLKKNLPQRVTTKKYLNG